MYAVASSDVIGQQREFKEDGYAVLKPANRKCDIYAKGDHIVVEDGAQRSDTFKKYVRAALEHADPVLLKRTADKLGNSLDFESSEELNWLAQSLLAKVMDDEVVVVRWSKYARCSATYADITYQLNLLMGMGKRTTKFKKMLVRSLRQLFDATLKNVKLSQFEEKEINSLHSLCSFCAHLYVRGLLGLRDIATLMQNLIGEEQPEKQLIQCACELLHVIGKSIDSSEDCMWMDKFSERLCSLPGARRLSAGKSEPIYDQEVRNMVAEVHQAREHGWPERREMQILVKLEEVSAQEALCVKADLGLQEAAQGNDVHRKLVALLESGSIQPLKVSTLVNDRPCAVLFVKDPDNFRQEIKKQTGIHERRLVLFMPDGTMLQNEKKSIKQSS